MIFFIKLLNGGAGLASSIRPRLRLATSWGKRYVNARVAMVLAPAEGMGMVTLGRDGAVNVQITWPKLVAAVAPIVVTVGLGYWALIEKTIDGISESVASLSVQTGQRLEAGALEDRDIRRVIEDVNTLLRVEMQASRTEFGQRIETLGDRIVAANQEVGKQVGLLRAELTASMDKRDAAVQGRFDRIEQKIDNMLGRISYERIIPVPEGTLMIDATGISSTPRAT